MRNLSPLFSLCEGMLNMGLLLSLQSLAVG